MGLSIDTKGYGTVACGKKSGESIISENVIKASGEVRTKQSREFMEGKGREGMGREGEKLSLWWWWGEVWMQSRDQNCGTFTLLLGAMI